MSDFYEIDDIQFCDNTAEEASAAKAEVKKIVAALNARIASFEHLLAVAEDVNRWLIHIDLGGTGHQLSLAKAIEAVDGDE